MQVFVYSVLPTSASAGKLSDMLILTYVSLILYVNDAVLVFLLGWTTSLASPLSHHIFSIYFGRTLSALPPRKHALLLL